MRPFLFALVGLLALVVAAQEVAGGALSGAADLESARANARAGGPTSEYDRDLLRRYGCSSGTHSPYCRSHRTHSQHRTHQRRVYRR
jgi:hypothetical protein